MNWFAGISVDSSGRFSYVTTADRAYPYDTPDKIIVFDNKMSTVVTTIPVGNYPHTDVYPYAIAIKRSSVCATDTNGSTQAGIDQCKSNPSSCGITLNDTNGSTQAGIDQCKTNPASCGITLNDTNGSTQTGIDQCKANPASCGITLNDTNGSTQTGIDQCKNNPSSCGLFTQAQLDATKQACKANPASCGITLNDTNGSTQTGIEQCKADPASCEIDTLAECIADYQLTGQLHIPCVNVPAGFGKTIVYDVWMQQRADPNVFIFDLDLNSIKQW